MSETVTDIDRLIASTWASLSGARAVAWHSPNAETIRAEEILAERLDWLLDRRLRAMGQEADALALVT